MAPKTKKQPKQKGGDDVDTKLQHAVTTLNELAASLSAVLESRGATVPAAVEAPAAEEAAEETPAVEETPAAEETPAEGASEEPAAGGGKKKKKAAKKAAPKKK